MLFSKKLFNEILSLKENEVIRDVIHRHSDLLLTIEGEKWTVIDIDTPKEFTDARSNLEESMI